MENKVRAFLFLMQESSCEPGITNRGWNPERELKDKMDRKCIKKRNFKNGLREQNIQSVIMD